MIVVLMLLIPAFAAGSDETAAIEEIVGGMAGPGLAAPIINGEEATEDDYPQAGAMLLHAYLDLGSYGEGEVKTITCSSTLIAPDVVMLASHCLDEVSYTYGMGSMEIYEIRWSRQADLTEWDGTTRFPEWPEDSIAAIDWVEHEDFDLYTMSTGIAQNYDVALLFLETPVTDTPYAYLPTPDEGDQLYEDAPVTVVGWGMQVAGESAMDTPDPGTYAIKMQGESVVGEIGDYEFQVGPEEEDVRKCHGDSGGPTFANVETEATETLRVVGITSHAFDRTDCKTKGGVDTRAFAYRDWIEAQMTARCEDGTRSWCEEYGLPLPPIPEPEVVENNGGDDEKRRACACASATPGGSVMGLLLGAAALLRRRRA